MAEARPSSRSLLLHGGVYTASRFLNQGVVFLLLPLYAHLLGTTGLGVVELMTVARGFLAVFLAQGLDAAWFRLRFETEGDERRRFESTIVWFLLAWSAVVLTLIWVFRDAIGSRLTPGVPFWPLGFWSALTASALLVASLLDKKLQADKRPFAFAVFGLARTLVTLLAIIEFVAVLRRGAAGKIEGEAVAASLAAVFSLVALAPRPAFSVVHLKRSMRYGWPLVPHVFAGIVNDQIDRFVVGALLGLQAVGVYSMGYRLAGVVMTMMIAQNQAFAPMFIETLGRAQREERDGNADVGKSLREQLATFGFLTVMVACTTAQIVSAGARELLLFATTPQFRDSWRVVAPVAAGAISWAWYSTLSQSITYRTETVHRLPFITVAAAATNLGANMLLVPRFGIDGAAWATFLSNSSLALGAYHLGKNDVRLPYSFRRWAVASLCAGASLIVIWRLDAALDAPFVRIPAKAVWLAASLAFLLKVSGVRVRALVRAAFRRGAPE